MQTLPEYAYFNASQQRVYVATSDVNFSGTWSSAAIYKANKDVVYWGTGTDTFIAIDGNLNSPPGAGPWSALVQLEDGTAYDLPPTPPPAYLPPSTPGV